MTRFKQLILLFLVFCFLPIQGQENDSSVVVRSPYDVADSLMFGWMPTYQHDSIPPYSGSPSSPPITSLREATGMMTVTKRRYTWPG